MNNDNDRIVLYEKIKHILSIKIDCDTIDEFIKQNTIKNLGEGKEASVYLLSINNVDNMELASTSMQSTVPLELAVKPIPYNDDPEYIRPVGGKRSSEWIRYTTKMFNFMIEANATGFSYFPYIYKISKCPTGENSFQYVFYEAFDENLFDLLSKMTNSDMNILYDVYCQLLIINYYLEIICNMKYFDGKSKNHLVKKIDDPVEQTFEMDKYVLKFKHRFLIVIWDFHDMKYYRAPTLFERNFVMVTRDIDRYMKNIRIPQGLRKLINDANTDPKNTPKLLYDFNVSYMQKL